MRDKSVFDSSRSGEYVSAERRDEPGNENFTLSDGGGSDSGGMPKSRAAGDLRAAIAKGRLAGDWAWHPERPFRANGAELAPDAGRILTRAEIDALYPTGEYFARK